MKTHTLWIALALASCTPSAPHASGPHGSPDHASAPEQKAASSTAADDLAALDTRKPVPLQPMMAWHQKQNMMDHLVVIQEVTAALAVDDWQGVAQAAKRIASSAQMQQTCEHMGAGADGFTDLALDFHRRADAIGVAAKQQDAKAVLQATSTTLQACTQCHATYRQEVVSADVWSARTGATHTPSPGMHHR